MVGNFGEVLIWRIGDFVENRQIQIHQYSLLPSLKIHQCILMTDSPNLMLAKVSHSMVVIIILLNHIGCMQKNKAIGNEAMWEHTFMTLCCFLIIKSTSEVFGNHMMLWDILWYCLAYEKSACRLNFPTFGINT